MNVSEACLGLEAGIFTALAVSGAVDRQALRGRPKPADCSSSYSNCSLPFDFTQTPWASPLAPTGITLSDFFILTPLSSSQTPNSTNTSSTSHTLPST